jgi:hypothetical protein
MPRTNHGQDRDELHAVLVKLELVGLGTKDRSDDATLDGREPCTNKKKSKKK